MDNRTITPTAEESQAPRIELQLFTGAWTAKTLTKTDRRLLVAATLRLFLRRIRHGISVTSDDLLHLAPYADPPEERAA